MSGALEHVVTAHRRLWPSRSRIGKRHSQDFVVAIRLQRPRVPVVGGGVAADGLALLDRDLSDRAANATKSVDGFPSTRACTPAKYPRAIRQGRALPRMRIRLNIGLAAKVVTDHQLSFPRCAIRGPRSGG